MTSEILSSTVEVEPQTVAAQRMYDPRASTYDDSWHPSYSERFCALLALRPGTSVLDLACGTGLDALLAADEVGPDGEVVAIDVSSAMLAQADTKLALANCNTKLLQHDVTDLDTLEELQDRQGEKGFDAIVCSNAMVLFDDPGAVVRGWAKYLKKGGFLAVDVAHERENAGVAVMQRVAERMGVEYPVPRSWLSSRESMRDILDREGFHIETEAEMDKVPGEHLFVMTEAHADSQFEYITMRSRGVADSPFIQQARVIFKEEWEKEVREGGVELVNSMYVYIARKK